MAVATEEEYVALAVAWGNNDGGAYDDAKSKLEAAKILALRLQVRTSRKEAAVQRERARRAGRGRQSVRV